MMNVDARHKGRPRRPSLQHGTDGRGLLFWAGMLYVSTAPLDLLPLPFGTPVRFSGSILIAAWIATLARGRTWLPRPRWALGAIIALVVWSLVTVSWSIAPEASIDQAVATGLVGLSAIAVAGAFRDSVRPALAALAIGSTLAGSLALVGGREVIETSYGSLESQQISFSGVDQNALAFNLTLGMAAATYLLVRRRAPSALLWAGPISILAISLILLGSRTGVGALIAIAVIALTSSFGSRKRAFSAAVVVALLALLTWGLITRGLIPTRVLEWMASPTLVDSRSEIIVGYRTTFEEWVFRGVGAGADAAYLLSTMASYENAHSAFWKVWIELGLVGLTLWLALLVSVTYAAYRSPDRLFFVLTAPPISFFFYSLGPLNSNALWVVFGLALASVSDSGDAVAASEAADQQSQAGHAMSGSRSDRLSR